MAFDYSAYSNSSLYSGLRDSLQEQIFRLAASGYLVFCKSLSSVSNNLADTPDFGET